MTRSRRPSSRKRRPPGDDERREARPAISALRLSVSRPELLSSMSPRDGFASPHASVSRLSSSMPPAPTTPGVGAIAEISLLIPAGVAIPPPPGSPYTSVRIEKPEKQTSYI